MWWFGNIPPSLWFRKSLCFYFDHLHPPLFSYYLFPLLSSSYSSPSTTSTLFGPAVSTSLPLLGWLKTLQTSNTTSGSYLDSAKWLFLHSDCFSYPPSINLFLNLVLCSPGCYVFVANIKSSLINFCWVKYFQHIFRLQCHGLLFSDL